jgi:hypothetical protein
MNERFGDTPGGPPFFYTGHMPHVISDSACRHSIWSWGAIRLWIIPPTAWGDRHDAGASPSRLPTCWDSSLGGEPGEQGSVGDAGLAPDVRDRETAGAQEPGKRLWADTQPPLRFGEGKQLRWRGQLQGEVLLPRGRACPGAWVSGRGSHGRGLTSQERDVRRGG